MRPQSVLFSAGLVLAFVLAAAAASAQYNTAEINGVVKDEQGAVIPGAAVVAVHEASGLKVERISDVDGRFSLRGLPVGVYTITIELTGFKQFSRPGLTVNVGQKLDLSVT